MSSPIEQIKQRLSVVDVVSSYIKLQKAGANFKAPCPFHSEKAPSFYVSPPREIWHCFGCNRGGDMFEFVKQIEGVEFPEALRILADRAGVDLIFKKQDVQFQNEKTRLLDLLKDAAFFYQKQLAQNKAVLDYLWKRGLKNETLKKFNVGFSPKEENGWRNLTNYLKSKSYSGIEIEKAGLAVRKSEGEYYDRFRGRVMFPLKDGSGRTVGFSGRVFHLEAELPSGSSASATGFDSAKYINTPQTVLYDKSKILYGFDLAKVGIRKQDACVLVEGQMDVLMSHQAGVENTIAVSGTALTPQHLNIIKRLTNNIVMAFDGDDAGLEAAKRSVNLAFQNNLEVRAISLPQGKDPAEAILESSEKWQKIVKESSHVIDFYLDSIKRKQKDDSRVFKLEVEKSVLPYVAFIQSEIEKNHWIKKIAGMLEVREEAVLAEVQKARSPFESSGEVSVESSGKMDIPKTRLNLLEERLAGIVLWKKDKNLIPDFVQKQVFDISEKAMEEQKNKLIFEAELYYGGSEKLEDETQNLARELKKETLKRQLEELAGEVGALELKGKKEELQKKLNEFQKLSKELAEI